ncbi:hypothetical protein YN1HA_15240 [Sulfurisphaera ohwakuensis]
MILVPKIYADLALGFDIIMLTTALLFRKPKPKKEISSLGRKSTKLLGLYLVSVSVAGLIISHMGFYTSYVDYFTGLAIDSFVFYVGLRCLYV